MAARSCNVRLRALVCAAAVVAATALVASPPADAQGAIGREQRLQGVRAEIRRLERELTGLRGRELGVLGEIERLGKDLRLREAQLDEVTLRIEDVDRQLDSQNVTLSALGEAQDRRREYLSFRLREIYRAGPDQALRRVVAGEELDRYLAALRYAALLSERDSTILVEFRADAVVVEREERVLAATRAELDALGRDLEGKRSELSRARTRRRQLLNAIREDQNRREAALVELAAAADSLSRLIDSVEPQAPGAGPAVDVRKFRGLLDWPSGGDVTAGFGTIVHPRFKTRVPHPGLDIAGKLGDDIRAVFDGTVVYAAWMRGYGLTAIVDHGGDMLSIYAHASVLLVESGQQVLGGQSLGKVGDSGSLRGPYLYFELRINGKPTDPEDWLRRR